MQRTAMIVVLGCWLASLAGCSHAVSRLRSRPGAAAALDPIVRARIEQGIVEPGYTPEMVYFALGRPMAPIGADIDQTRDGVWEYQNQERNDRDFIRQRFRQRRVFDPDRKSDVIITEPVDDRVFPHLRDYVIEIEFHDGRVTSIRRVLL